MSRALRTIGRYETCRALLNHRVEAVVVGDPAGSQLSKAIQETHKASASETENVWQDLLRAAGMLRWRRMTQPQPNVHAPDLWVATELVLTEAAKLRGLVNDESYLDAVESAVALVSQGDCPVGAELLTSILEVGPENCLVIANSGRAQLGLSRWLSQYSIDVWLLSEVRDLDVDYTQSYVVGPPVFFSPSVVTAPITEGVTFVIPSWFTNHSLVESVFSQHVENPIAPALKVYHVGDFSPSQTLTGSEAKGEDDPYYPKFVARAPSITTRPPEPYETFARKIRMSGGLSLWLDDGERIRTLNLEKAHGSRIDYAAVDDVTPGTYLVLREGQTEPSAMNEAAYNALEADSEEIRASQSEWKSTLESRIASYGTRYITKVLEHRGVRAPNRVRAWVDPLLVCPRYDDDLRLLLEWLDLPEQPYLKNALQLRKAKYKASVELRRQLEDAVTRADLTSLEESGSTRLALTQAGFRSMIVCRVLEVESREVIVARHNARIPFEEDSNRWLE